MYVRLTKVTGAANVAAAVEYLESVRSAVEAMAGHRGLAILADEPAATIGVASYWETPEQLEAADGAVAKLRTSALEIAGGGEVTVEVYEAAVTKRFSMPGPGAVARLLRLQVDPAEFDAAIAFWTDVALPSTSALAGLVSAQLLVDRATGKGVSVTGWASRADLEAALPALTALRERALEVAPSSEPLGIEEYSLVSTTAQLGT